MSSRRSPPAPNPSVPVAATDTDSFDPVEFKRRLHHAIRAAVDIHRPPLTATQIFEAVRSDVPRISLATIRRALRELVMNGTLHLLDIAGATPTYAQTPHFQSPHDESPEQHIHTHRNIPRFVPGIGPLHRIDPARRPSTNDALQHLASMRTALIAAHTDTVPDPLSVALPPGLDRSVLETQPFQARTWDCLNAASLFQGTDPLTVRDLLRMQHFGHGSLRNLLLVVENYLKQCTRTPGAHNDVTLSTPYRPPPAPPPPTPSFPPWFQPFHQLLAAASEFLNATTLSEILAPSIVRLSSSIDLLSQIEAIGLDTIVDSRITYTATILDGLQDLCARLTATQRTVVELRLLSFPPKTLAEAGAALDISRERVRQIQTKIVNRIQISLNPAINATSAILRTQFGSIAQEFDVDSRLVGLFPDDGTPGPLLARHLIKSELGYVKITNGVCLDPTAVDIVRQMRSAAYDLSEDGIIDQPRLQASLPDDYWRKQWPLLLRCCSFYEFLGSLCVRESARTRTKAALLSIGEPATREQIGELCGVSEERAGSYLSSFDAVVRADKSRWGLSEWIDDEYEGIVSEIIQRIQEDGGTTTTRRLFEELPRKFGVTTGSVRAYLQTPRFALHDGHVSLADTSSLQLRDIEDVIHGYDDRSLPYWSFAVHQRHLDGFSLSGVPPELAHHMGCSPDGGVHLQITNPPECRNLSLHWRLSSHVGATIGYLAEPLRRIGAKHEARVRLTLVDTGTVELSLVEELKSTDRDEIVPAYLLSRMKHRRKVL